MAVDQAGPEFQRALAAQRHEWEQQHASEMLSLAQEWTRRWSERERTWAQADEARQLALQQREREHASKLEELFAQQLARGDERCDLRREA